MEDTDKKQKILHFLKDRQLCVLSTINNERTIPQSAVVAFTETETLELIFCTSNTSRKYKNIQTNAHVSVVIGWDSGTVQYEGTVRELAGEEANKYGEMHIQKNPQTKQFMHHTDQKFFLITPTWIRYFDHDGNPPERYELTF